MCAQRVLRAGPGADVIRSQPGRHQDDRQGSLELELPEATETSAERAIYRLSREVAELRMKLAGAGASEYGTDLTYRSYNSARGWIDAVDPIALLARQFARRLAEVKCIRSLGPAGDATDSNAQAVNSYIAIIAEEANGLINALIEDAEASGLEATGAWLKIPLLEYREFEAVKRDPAIERADHEQDQKLNS